MDKTLREAYGEALVEYGNEFLDFVVLDADVSGSTQSGMFRDAHPERFFNVGIAEANMAAMAAGFAAAGKTPLINSFGVFLTSIGLLAARTYGSYSGLDMKFVGAYGGLSDAFDGPTHHSLEDVAIMRTLPDFEVIVASDVHQVKWVVRHALTHKGPMYIRLSRDATQTVYDEKTEFEPGRGKIVRAGTDATVIACGAMVGEAIKAAELLEKEGLHVRVADMFFIKPLDRELIIRCAQETGALITAEEHSRIGGLGGAVAEVLAAEDTHVPLEYAGLEDTHAECGPYAALMEKYGLDAHSVATKIKRAIGRK